MTAKEFAEIIESGLKETKKIPTEVAKEAGMTRQELWRIRKGKASVRRINQFYRLCKSLNIPFERFLEHIFIKI